jgi:hypothetical protein
VIARVRCERDSEAREMTVVGERTSFFFNLISRSNATVEPIYI